MGALFLVGRFLKVMFLPDYGEKASYQEFGGTPRQLEAKNSNLTAANAPKTSNGIRPSVFVCALPSWLDTQLDWRKFY